uniref:Autophagy protein 5 n=1 Tax=Albugo laibachii Nc14 TaxID=890382 RepID=F0WLN0_9STRA|nr:adenylate kinase putative [Albugo laibachii Nc14]|eukprot:CCA22196.1 adenylate kinase putative [Albugo laibachii Nc14]
MTQRSEEVNHLLWEGQIPVCFWLNASEASVLDPPEPFYVREIFLLRNYALLTFVQTMIPRLSYLPAYIQRVISHFQHAVPAIHIGNTLTPSRVWFDYEGTPLRWHYPIGVLYDLFLTQKRRQEQQCPWKLCVHFHSFPTQTLLPLENEKSIESHFMQSLKQSTFARLGSSKVIMRMSEAQQRQMWQSVVQRMLQYELSEGSSQILSRVLGSAIKFNEAIQGLYDTDTAKHPIPVRLLVGKEAFVQLRVPPEEQNSLQDVVRWALNADSTDAENEDTVMIHGVAVPTSLAVSLVYRYFSYPDVTLLNAMPRVFVHDLTTTLGKELTALFSKREDGERYQVVGAVPKQSQVAEFTNRLASGNTVPTEVPVVWISDSKKLEVMVQACDVVIASIVPYIPPPLSFAFRGAKGLEDASKSAVEPSDTPGLKHSALEVLKYFATGLGQSTDTDSEIPRRFIAISSLLTWSGNEAYSKSKECILYKEEQFKIRKPNKRYLSLKTIETQVLSAKKPGKLDTFVIGAGVIYGGFETQLGLLLKHAWMHPNQDLMVPSVHQTLQGGNCIPCISVFDLAIFAQALACIPIAPQTKQYLIAVDTASKHVTLRDVCRGISCALGNKSIRIVEDVANDKELSEWMIMEEDELWEPLQMNLCFDVDPSQLNVTLEESDANGLRNETQLPLMFEVVDSKRWKHMKGGLLGHLNFFVRDFIQQFDLSPPKIVVLGSPQSGKSVLSQKLAAEYHIERISLGRLMMDLLAVTSTSASMQSVQDEIQKWKETLESDDGSAKHFTDEEWTYLAWKSLSEDTLVKLTCWKLESVRCRNHGYVLDGFPGSSAFAEALFTADDSRFQTSAEPVTSDQAQVDNESPIEETVNVTEEEKVEKVLSSLQPMERSSWPNRVIMLHVIQELAVERAQNLSEEIAIRTGNTQNEFKNRWEEFEKNRDSLLHVFETGVKTSSADADGNQTASVMRSDHILDEDDERSGIEVVELQLESASAYTEECLYMQPLRQYIESAISIHNFHPTLKEIQEYKDKKAAKKLKQEVEIAQIQHDEDERLAQESMQKLAADQRRLEILEREEKELIEARAKPLREYLMDNILPALTEGVLDIVKHQPTDPIDHLAEFLFRKAVEYEENHK